MCTQRHTSGKMYRDKDIQYMETLLVLYLHSLPMGEIFCSTLNKRMGTLGGGGVSR